MQRSFYEVLGVPRNATRQEIKDKYHNLARQYHPDRAKDKVLADKLFVQINRAYTTLQSDLKRAQYDASLDALAYVPPQPSAPRMQQTSQPAARASQSPPSAPQPVTAQQIRQWFDQASRLQLKGDFDQAIHYCQLTLNADPSNFPGLLLMGDLLADTGKLDEGLAMYERATKIQPANRLLREKMTRLSGLISRRTTLPGIARRASENIAPPPVSQSKPSVSSAEKTPPKSFIDRLMNRK
jgi:curved DNA-binding protein CbpA